MLPGDQRTVPLPPAGYSAEALDDYQPLLCRPPAVRAAMTAADAELGEGVSEVVFNRFRAQVQLGGRLAVG